MPNLPAFQRRNGGRIALVAEATIYGRKVVTYNLHLESRGADDLRLRQLNEVLADCRKYVDRPRFVVAGDFNFDAGGGDAAKVSPRRRLPRRRGIVRGANHHCQRLCRTHAGSTGSLSPIRPIPKASVHYEIHASDHYPVSATLVQPCAAA